MANAIEGDTAFAAGILRSCFGQGGDFTVVVEEQVDSDTCGKFKLAVVLDPSLQAFKFWDNYTESIQAFLACEIDHQGKLLGRGQTH